ncbi:uncharacterized protein LOC126776541 [Nymphalis io]|uniref:uncharacterized protein LOC126776541 n=1 Tax=Inachis io TaxID=171585 RepID=UPI0021671079|nr:uncharacterized protein LOC126776541 [Nymphalis io]
MDKENNKSAAGLRRSAIVERLRLREEWSALKETSNEPILRQNNKNVPTKKPNNLIISFPKRNGPSKQLTKINEESNYAVSEVLRGTVVLVDVGSELKALPLRAALTALGASVVPSWSPLVTHLVWCQGGGRAVRARARALAAAVVSPLWVEACAAAGRRLPERVFPAPARPSDLPSPATLRRLLKKAEQENISLQNLLSDSVESDKDAETRVNTAPRRALPASPTPQRPTKSKRKLFTQKEADINSADESDKEDTPIATNKPRGRRQLARAERLARRLAGRGGRGAGTPAGDGAPRVVLTGMSRGERREIWEAIKRLNGRVQNQINKKTTHVLMGSCDASSTEIPAINDIQVAGQKKKITMCQNCNTPEDILSQMFLNHVTVHRPAEANVGNIICSCNNISGVARISTAHTAEDITNVPHNEGNNFNKNPSNTKEPGPDVQTILTSSMELVKKDKPRTVNALLGAVRGCRVLVAQWARDSVKAKRWLHHFGYEVPHLMKISQKARIERSALGKMNSEYAYDIFNGMRVRVSENAEQKEAVNQLLTLCGAITHNKRNGAKKQNGGNITADFDITVGRESGEVCSKWVFDSIAAARIRTTRRYVNKDIPSDVIILS